MKAIKLTDKITGTKVKTVPNVYETEVNGITYVIKDGLALSSTGQTMKEEDVLKIVTKAKSEFSSSDWTKTDYIDIQEYLTKNKIEDEEIVIDDRIVIEYNDVRYTYDFIIARQDEEIIHIRELISKFNITTGEDIPTYNDNEGMPQTVSYKEGLTNTILWYAHEIGALKYMLEALDFTCLGTTWINDKGVICSPRSEDIYVFSRMQDNSITAKPSKKARTRVKRDY